jgi:hypothetical protein
MPGMGGVEACRRIFRLGQDADDQNGGVSDLSDPCEALRFPRTLSRMLALRGKAIASVTAGPIKESDGY